VRIERPDADLNQTAFADGAREVFFFANSSAERTIDTIAEFVTGAKTPWVWDPETGERQPYPSVGAANRLRICLGPAASLLLVFEPGMKGPAEARRVLSAQNGIELAGAWGLRLVHVSGERQEISLDRLIDFKDDDQLKTFAGEAIYRKSFQLEGAARFEFLDLGTVPGVSVVKLNGRDLGVRWYGRHVYPIKELLRDGSNDLEIRVTTTLGNYCKSLVNNPVAQEWLTRRKQPLQSAGLLGPVRVLPGEVL
jgi:hypothetical protein